MKELTLLLVTILCTVSFGQVYETNKDMMLSEIQVSYHPKSTLEPIKIANKRMLMIRFNFLSWEDSTGKKQREIEKFQEDYLQTLEIVNVDSVVILDLIGNVNLTKALSKCKSTKFVALFSFGSIRIDESEVKNSDWGTFYLYSYNRSRISLNYLDNRGVHSAIFDGAIPRLKDKSNGIAYIELNNPSSCFMLRCRKRMKSLEVVHFLTDSYHIPKYSNFSPKEGWMNER